MIRINVGNIFEKLETTLDPNVVSGGLVADYVKQALPVSLRSQLKEILRTNSTQRKGRALVLQAYEPKKSVEICEGEKKGEDRGG